MLERGWGHEKNKGSVISHRDSKLEQDQPLIWLKTNPWSIVKALNCCQSLYSYAGRLNAIHTSPRRSWSSTVNPKGLLWQHTVLLVLPTDHGKIALHFSRELAWIYASNFWDCKCTTNYSSRCRSLLGWLCGGFLPRLSFLFVGLSQRTLPFWMTLRLKRLQRSTIRPQHRYVGAEQWVPFLVTQHKGHLMTL